ncbi:MAG: aspartate/glutamate racemase family protein [Alsobacter sp.]
MNRPIRLLALNPNTSSEVTDRFVAEARRAAAGRAEISGVTGRFGARIVVRRAENAIAGHAALDLLACHAGGFDAVILAISFDTALAALREVSPVPVVGITAAAVAAAATAGGVGLLTFGEASRPLYEDLVASGALGDVVRATASVPVADADGYLAQGALDDKALAAIEGLAGQAGVGAVALCGAAIVGMARRLAGRSPLPLFDGAGPSVEAALALARRGPAPAAPVPRFSACVGLSPELAFLLGGPPPAASTPSFPT